MSETVLSHVEALFNQEQCGGEVTLVKVCEPPDLIADYPAAIMRLSWDEHVKQAKSAAKEASLVYLKEKQKQLEAKGIKVNIEVVLGENAIPAIYPGASFRPCGHDYTRPFQNERMALGSRGGPYYPGEHQAAFAYKTPCKHGFYRQPINQNFRKE
jgi:hypothetical protein